MPEETPSHRAGAQPAPHSGRMWVVWIVAWAVHLGLWILYANQFSLHELIAGSIAAAVAVVGYAAVWKHGHVPFVPRWGDALQIWRMPWYAVSGAWEVLHGLMVQLMPGEGAPSVTSAAPFRWGGDDSHDTARRALAVTYTTLTPNFVVLDLLPPPHGGDDQHGAMLYHQILPGPVITMAENLGAEEGEGAVPR